MPVPHDQVAFVVAGDQPRFHFGRPLIDQHHVLQFALSSEHSAATGFSPTVATAQAGHQLAFQFPARHDVNVTVDRFMGGVHAGEAWVIELEDTRDFLRRPAAPQLGMHFVTQGRVFIDGAMPPARGSPACHARLVRGGGTVATPATIERQFPADRASRTPQPYRHQLLRITRPHRRLQFDSLRQAQMLVSHRLALGARRTGGKRWNERRTAKPVLRSFHRFKRSCACVATSYFWFSILRTRIQIGHSTSSLSAPCDWVVVLLYAPPPVTISYTDTVFFADLE